MKPLLHWLRFQLVIDLAAGLLLLTLPLSLLAEIPVPVVPTDATAVRLLGLYPVCLAIAFYAATSNGVNGRAAWIANAIRFAGGCALLAGATVDPAAPVLLRAVFAGEFLFAAITAFLMAQAGLSWWRPA